MDRKQTIGYVLIFIIIAVTFYLNQQNASEIEKFNKTEDSLKLVAKKDSINQAPIQTPNQTPNQTPDQAAVQTLSADSLKEVEVDLPEEIYSIENSKLKIGLSSKGGKISGANLKSTKTFDKKDLYLLNNPNDTFNYKIYFADGFVNTSKLDFKPAGRTKSGIILEAQTHGGIIRMTYELKPETYKLKYNLELINCEKLIPQSQNYIDFKWVSNIGLAERTISDEQATTTVYYKYKSDDDVENISQTETEEKKLLKGLEWVSYKQKFFNTTLISKTGFQDMAVVSSEIPVTPTNSSIKRLSSSFVLPYSFKPNEKYEFEFYIGPNHYQTLSNQDIGLQKIITLGFFGWVSKFMIIPIFNWLAGFIANFGLVILSLTLIIKLILFPLVYKSYVSTAKMRILKPEIDEIKEKYGTDMTRIQQENMKLYKRAGVSPLGGCFPMLLQLPILLAMFNFFPASIELRQKAFLWAGDLSTYDSILELGFEIPFYGSHISLFTLLMTVSTLLYTRMNNQLTGVSGQMKWISYLMPILFLGFFNNYASGLTYYYFLGNMITFGQNVLIRKFFVDEVKLHKQIEENKKKPVVIKKSGFQKRLEDMAKKNANNKPGNKKK
jgi:YidC/Oxa1 family membrane protein insertase